MNTVKLMQVVEVDAARLDALTPEAFRLVLEARGWVRRALVDGEVFEDGARALLGSTVAHNRCAVLARLAERHSGSTFDAFAEVERVQVLLAAVEAAERGHWHNGTAGDTDLHIVRLTDRGWVFMDGDDERLWPSMRGERPDPERAAREARRQLPALVRIICGLDSGE